MNYKSLLKKINNSKCPRFNPDEKTDFIIRMDNKYLNAQGRVPKNQSLVSAFTRTISAGKQSNYYATNYNFENVTYKENSKKSGERDAIEWNFIKKHTLNYHVFAYPETKEDDLAKKLVEESTANFMENLAVTHQKFAAFPKLPSVYLMIMQVMDIFGFETYLSYVSSIHELTEIGKPYKVSLMNKIVKNENATASIDFGLFSDKSYFQEADFFMTNLGIAAVNGKPCILYDYFCDGAKVMMQEKNRPDIKRSGSSYYSGYVYIDIETGDLAKATMLESYIALQYAGVGEDAKKAPVHIRRNITLEAINKKEN